MPTVYIKPIYYEALVLNRMFLKKGRHVHVCLKCKRFYEEAINGLEEPLYEQSRDGRAFQRRNLLDKLPHFRKPESVARKCYTQLTAP